MRYVPLVESGTLNRLTLFLEQLYLVDQMSPNGRKMKQQIETLEKVRAITRERDAALEQVTVVKRRLKAA